MVLSKFSRSLLLKTLLCGAAVFFTACLRIPKADFKTDKDAYIGGEQVQVTNTSKNVTHYTWQFADTASTDQAPVFTLSRGDSGNVVIRLRAYDPEREMDNETSRTIFVMPQARGTLSVWSSKKINLDVYAIGQHTNYMGKIVSAFSSPPACNASGTVRLHLFIDTYTVKAYDKSGAQVWEQQAQVSRNQCTLVEIK